MELLSKIASGKDFLKAMRLVCTSWQLGFDASVTYLYDEACSYNDPPDLSIITRRFPGTTTLELAEDVEGIDFVALLGTRVRDLRFLCANGVSGILASLQALSISKLFLGYTDVDDAGASTLQGLTSLSDLSLEWCQEEEGGITEQGYLALQGLPLTRFSVSCSWCFNEVAMAVLATFKFLRVLDLSFTEVTDDGFKFLRGIPLTDLRLDRPFHLTGACLKWLAGLPLTKLFMAGIAVTDEEMADFTGLAALVDLGFQRGCWVGSGITARGFGGLKNLRLRALDLNAGLPKSLCVDDKFLEMLKGMPLQFLDLSGADLISNQGLKELRNLPLTKLVLDRCASISDMAYLPFPGMPLSSLSLRNCDKLTDAGIVPLLGLPLTDLDLTGCEGLTDTGLLMLSYKLYLKKFKFSASAAITAWVFKQ